MGDLNNTTRYPAEGVVFDTAQVLVNPILMFLFRPRKGEGGAKRFY